MRRSVGHKVGLTFYAASIGTIGAMLAKPEWSKTPLRFLLAGGALAGIGYYFRNTLYLNDPEAVAEYRKEIESIAFSQAMKKYSLDDLIKLLDTNTLRTYYEREMNNSNSTNSSNTNNNNKTGHHNHKYLDISVAIERFSIEGLKKLLSTGIVPLDDLKMRFDCLVNSSANFTALWQKLGVSSFNELRQMTVLKAETCRQLFMREFWYVTPDGQDQTMIGRPAGYHSTAGAPLGLIRALTQYGEVASQIFGVSKEFFQGAIEHSKYGRKVTLAELLAEGLLGLEERGYVRAEFVDRKLRETMYGKSGADGDSGMHSRTTSCASSNGSENNSTNNKERFLAENNNNNKNNNNTNGGSTTPPKSRITLWQAEDQLRLKELLDRKLVFIPSVAPLFHDAIPTKYFTNNQSPSKMNNVVLFYEHWEKYLVANPTLIPAMYRMTINSMSRQAARAKKEKEDALYKAKTDLEKIAGKTIVAELDNLKALAKTELNQKSKQRREQLIEVTTNAKHAYDKAKKAAEENYQRTIIELHKDFCASVLEMKSNQ